VRRLTAIMSFACASALAACASAPALAPVHATPQLRLAPALLKVQRVAQQLDVLLEADAHHVQLGVVAMGQVAARLEWDGVTLTEDKAPWWPQAVSGSRILSDLQLTLWPVAAIQAALPPGWQLVESGDVCTLTDDGAIVTVITRIGPQVVELDQRREHFRLKIESRELADAAGRAS
jgi:hypothetical protein